MRVGGLSLGLGFEKARGFLVSVRFKVWEFGGLRGFRVSKGCRGKFLKTGAKALLLFREQGRMAVFGNEDGSILTARRLRVFKT